MKKVIFACVHSAGRSQMAAGWFNMMADPNKARAVAAGTQPAERVHAIVVDAMLEVGIDLSQTKPQLLTEGLANDAALLVTMGCGDACPIYPGKKYVDWEVQDPAGEPIEVVRRIRDDIASRVRALLSNLGVEETA